MSDGFDAILAGARVLHHDEEPLTIDAANMAGRPCERRCSVCDGVDVLHHWIDECADEGDPIQVCKHCPAWRPYPDDDVEDSGDLEEFEAEDLRYGKLPPA